MTRSVASLSALVLLAALAAGCSGGQASAAEEAAPAPPAVDIPVVRVARGPVEAALEISGTLAPRARVGVMPKLPGALERVLVDIGDPVSAGQVVATIDRREIDAQADAAAAAVAVAQASLEAAEATLAHAVIEHARARSLFDKGALPRQRLDAAETAARASTAQRDLAKANLAQAEAASRRAREVQRDATLTAPVSGFVVERNYDPGATPGDQPVVVVADLRYLELEAGVSELEAGRLKVGMPAAVFVEARPGDTFSGQLAAIAPEVSRDNRHFRVKVRVPNPHDSLLSGMFATSRLVVDVANDALHVPREAVTTRAGKRVVLRIANGALTPVEVVEGLTDGVRVQIVSGLEAGALVAADARRQVPAGAEVRGVEVR